MGKKYKQKYQQHKCDTPGCPNFIRTVCNCTKDIFRCNSCFIIHIMDSASCVSNFNWIQFAIFSFFVSLNYYCKIKTTCRNLFLLEYINYWGYLTPFRSYNKVIWYFFRNLWFVKVILNSFVLPSNHPISIKSVRSIKQ